MVDRLTHQTSVNLGFHHTASCLMLAITSHYVFLLAITNNSLFNISRCLLSAQLDHHTTMETNDWGAKLPCPNWHRNSGERILFQQLCYWVISAHSLRSSIHVTRNCFSSSHSLTLSLKDLISWTVYSLSKITHREWEHLTLKPTSLYPTVGSSWLVDFKKSILRLYDWSGHF